MKGRYLASLVALLLLTGCAPLLERTYSVSEPHSSKFWESEAAGTLRAENYQDIVNDLLILIGQHTESATLRLYEFGDEVTVTDILDRATLEVQQETPMGAYAVEYITTSSKAQRGYYEIALQIGYRRSAQQIQSVVSATSTEALYSLLETALDEGKTELAVRIGYWSDGARERVESTVDQLRQERQIPEEEPWAVLYYPAEGEAGLVEVLLEPDEEALEAVAEQTPEETQDGSESENGEIHAEENEQQLTGEEETASV